MRVKNLLDENKVRSEFPILKRQVHGQNLVYLDNAATTQKPDVVVDALRSFYTQHNANVHRGIYQLSEEATEAFENSRTVVKNFINASSENEIVFLRGVTEAINLVAFSFGEMMKAGDEVIISQMEHHANIVPWQLLAQRKKIVLKVIRLTDDGQLDLEHFQTLLSKKTKMVSITYASNVLGTINDIDCIIEKAHLVGAKVLIDAAQAPAHFAIDVQKINCDFLTFSGHKHYGPTGIGVLYGKEAILESMPPYHGGGSMIEKVTFKSSTYLPPPLKFEAGTPAYAEAIGLAKALEYIQAYGIDMIQTHEDALSHYAIEALLDFEGLKLYGPKKNRIGIFSFSIHGVHPHDVATILDTEGVAIRAGHHCAMPLIEGLGEPALTRASVGIYNNKEDIDRLMDGLVKVVKIFKL